MNSFYGMNCLCKLRDTCIGKAEQLLKEDRKVSLRELCGSLNVSFKRVHHIIIVKLGMSRACAMCPTYGLTDEQKRRLWKFASKILLLLNKTLTSYHPSIIICDHCWLRNCEPKSKQQLDVWKHKITPPPKKFHKCCQGKVTLMMFMIQKLLFFSTGCLGGKL
jgi:hypothetical protein